MLIQRVELKVVDVFVCLCEREFRMAFPYGSKLRARNRSNVAIRLADLHNAG
jgi:hypothetical protein